jgi:hypothetical protein
MQDRRGARTVTGLATVALVAIGLRGHVAAAANTIGHHPMVVLDALHAPDLLAVRAADPTGDTARLAVDGREDTVWTGRPGEMQWRWSAAFAKPVHVGLLRARFGYSATSGVPVDFRWETRPPAGDGTRCDASAPAGDTGWVALEGAQQHMRAATEGPSASPTRRSWFVDADACGLRLVVDRTNAGPPVLREVQAIESARDVLRGAEASANATFPGMRAAGAVDGTYGGRWAGAPGLSRWTLRVDLPEPQPIDRVRLVLGFDATSTPRAGAGRSYAVAWAPLHYTLEGSEDGRHFVPIATEPLRADGSLLPLRRRLVVLAEGRRLRALRLVMNGATGSDGLPSPGAVPVVREIAAYRADDARPMLASPWLLSINANPSAESRLTPGAEMTNDAYHAKFLQGRFAALIPALKQDDRFSRALGDHGEPLDAPPSDHAGEALESIEGDDPLLDAQLLAQSSPPPIAVLSGSNDWDYDSATRADAAQPRFWHWDPLRDARLGGMGQLAPAVRDRVAPLLGFCGGAQLLALLEARGGGPPDASHDDDQRAIDRILKRTSGHRIRGFAAPVDVERAWPTDPHAQHATIRFLPDDPLFADLAGADRRTTTQALPELHSDAVRLDAFVPGAPLERLRVVATSSFCAPDVVAANGSDAVFANPNGPGWCDTVPEAFRSRDAGWPVIGAQFHAEQRDFSAPAPGDPPESVADPRLFLAAAYEQIVDAYVRMGP